MSEPVEIKVAEIIEPSLRDMGYDLVRVSYKGGTLQIMAERAEDGSMSVDDCARISDTVSALLDVADPIKSHYTLEVSSPGLDRPLVRLSDFERFSGHIAKIELTAPLEEGGRRRFKGLLRGANGALIRLEVDEGELVEIPFSAVHQAKLDVAEDPLQRSPKKKPAAAKNGAKSPAKDKATAKTKARTTARTTDSKRRA